MKMKKKDLLVKLRSIFSAVTGYNSALQLAKACGVTIYRIYSAVRTLREGYGKEKPLGIHRTKKGYVLSEYASMTDDVDFMRRLNGTRTGVYIAANAAAPYIRPRWNSVTDQKAFRLIMQPFVSGGSSVLQRGMKLLVGKTKAGI